LVISDACVLLIVTVIVPLQIYKDAVAEVLDCKQVLHSIRNVAALCKELKQVISKKEINNFYLL